MGSGPQRRLSFLRGASSVGDVFGVGDVYWFSIDHADADARALAGDWSVVGADIRSAAGETK